MIPAKLITAQRTGIRLRATLCAALLSSVPGCGEASDAAEAEQSKPVKRTVAPSPTSLDAAALPGQIDPAPSSDGRPEIVEWADIVVNGEPSCAFTVRYPGAVEQPVTWNKEPCRTLTARFMSPDELGRLGKTDALTPEAREDMNRAGGPVFYVEGAFTASIFPLNVAGRIYEVPVAD